MNTAYELDRKLFSGIAWTGAATYSAQVFTWASTLIVARLLSPSDYGLVGMAGVYLGIVKLLSEFGIATSVITLRDLTQDQVSQLNCLALLLGAAAFAVSYLAAPELGAFFNSPNLPSALRVMSVGFIITAFQTVPRALLQRDMQFHKVAIASTVQALVISGTTIVLAVLGYGYWSLVLGNIAGACVLTRIFLSLRPHSYAAPKFRTVRSAVGFSSRVAGARLAWYSYSNSDALIAGRLLGQSALGIYSIANTLASIPVEKVTALIGQVTPSLFAAIQNDAQAIRRHLLQLTEMVSLVTFPVCAGMALVAEDFVNVILGSQWEPAVLPLRILALVAAVRSIAPLLGTVAYATRDERFGLKVSVAAAVLLPFIFLLCSTWGVPGIAVGWVLAIPVTTLPILIRVSRRLDLPIRDFSLAMWPAVSSALVMSGAVLVTMRGASDWTSHMRLAAAVLVGVTSYAAVLASLHHKRLSMYLATLRRSRVPPADAVGRPAAATTPIPGVELQ
jgi:O-antigen/teichoic acid export membrane protein